MSLKQHDIYVILKILFPSAGKVGLCRSLSKALHMSPPETNAAVKRSIQSGLMRPAFGAESNPQPFVQADPRISDPRNPLCLSGSGWRFDARRSQLDSRHRAWKAWLPRTASPLPCGRGHKDRSEGIP